MLLLVTEHGGCHLDLQLVGLVKVTVCNRQHNALYNYNHHPSKAGSAYTTNPSLNPSPNPNHITNPNSNYNAQKLTKQAKHLHISTCKHAAVLGLPTFPEWLGSSRNWPTVSCAPGEAHFVPEMWKLTTGHSCSLMSILYFVLCLSVTHDLTWIECNVTD